MSACGVVTYSCSVSMVVCISQSILLAILINVCNLKWVLSLLCGDVVRVCVGGRWGGSEGRYVSYSERSCFQLEQVSTT